MRATQQCSERSMAREHAEQRDVLAGSADGTVAVNQERDGKTGRSVSSISSSRRVCVTRKHAEQCNFLLDSLEQDGRCDGSNKQRKAWDGSDLVCR